MDAGHRGAVVSYHELSEGQGSLDAAIAIGDNAPLPAITSG
jgi:hypothetical protein